MTLLQRWFDISTSNLHQFNNSKWVWSGNTTITNCRQPRGTARKSRSTITRHQEDKLSKAISSLFPIKMIAAQRATPWAFMRVSSVGQTIPFSFIMEWIFSTIKFQKTEDLTIIVYYACWFYLIFSRSFAWYWVELFSWLKIGNTLVRCGVLRHHTRVFAVCWCPIYGTLWKKWFML